MIEREQIVRYCRQELDEAETTEVETAIHGDPEVRALYQRTAQDILLDDLVDEDLLPDETDPEVDATRRFIAQQMHELRRSEWWSVWPDDPGALANLAEGEGTTATVRRVVEVREKYEPDSVTWREDEFRVTISRLGIGRYRFDADRWPSRYTVRSLRLARFHLPDFATVTAGTLPRDEKVRPANVVRETNAAGVEQVLGGSTAAGAGRDGAAGWLAADSDDDKVTLSAREGETEIKLDHERLHITVETPEDRVLAVVELECHSDRRGRLPVERRAVALKGDREQKRGSVGGFDHLPKRIRSDQLRVMVRPLGPQDLYLLQTPSLRTHMDNLLADQPARAASVHPTDGGYEVELRTEQYELAADPASCWALMVVPTN